MAFGDWTQVIVSNMAAALDLGSPINGSGSLLLSRTSTSIVSTNYAGMHLNTGSFTVGVTKGRIRTLMQIEKSNVGTTTSDYNAMIGALYNTAFDPTYYANA